MATDKAAEEYDDDAEVGLKSSSGALMLIHPRKSLCISRLTNNHLNASLSRYPYGGNGELIRSDPHLIQLHWMESAVDGTQTLFTIQRRAATWI